MNFKHLNSMILFCKCNNPISLRMASIKGGTRNREWQPLASSVGTDMAFRLLMEQMKAIKDTF